MIDFMPSHVSSSQLNDTREYLSKFTINLMQTYAFSDAAWLTDKDCLFLLDCGYFFQDKES